MNKFRCLHADEIECRVQQVKDNGLILLLYKDARCDMTILDETVGAMNWQREHRRDNANCVVSIWDSEKSSGSARKTPARNPIRRRKRASRPTASSARASTGASAASCTLHRLSGSRQGTTPPPAASAMTNSRSRRSSTRKTTTAPTVTKS